MNWDPQSEYTKLAFRTIEAFIQYPEKMNEIENETIPDCMKVQAGCFVSIHKTNGDLRGCIGTIEAVRENLHAEIFSNAIASVSRDSRFSPVQIHELKNIEITVDVLSIPEKISSIDELDVEKYGIIVSDGVYGRGVLLPSLEGINSVSEQIRIACRKAGISPSSSKLLIEKFTSKRYY